MLSSTEANRIAKEAQSVELAEVNKAILEAAGSGYFSTRVYVTESFRDTIALALKEKGFNVTPEEKNAIVIKW